MKTIIILPVLLLFSFTTFATSQFSDILIWGRDTLMLFTNPLNSIPDWENYRRIIQQEFENEARKLNTEECGLQFTNGHLIDTVLYHNYIVKESKFSLDPNPNNFLEFIYSQITWEGLPNMESDHFQVNIGVQPNIKGEIDSIIWNTTYCISKSGFQLNKDNAFIKEAIRIAYLIPEWDVIVQRGRIVPRSLFLQFDINQRKKYTR
ncbi:MAG: hypothetical protein Q8M08_12270 [Bacteroidales bacterium]|nr:hypothetical protein [Bacteroidales bacterium]